MKNITDDIIFPGKPLWHETTAHASSARVGNKKWQGKPAMAGNVYVGYS
jgi:hypothetical protein